MLELRYTKIATDELYPKVHALEDGGYEVIFAEPEEVESYLLELKTGSWPASGTHPFMAVVPDGRLLLNITLGSAPMVEDYAFSTYGYQYDDNLMVNIPIPEPVMVGSDWAWDYTHVYLVHEPNVSTLTQPIEVNGKLVIPQSGGMIDLATMTDETVDLPTTTDFLSQTTYDGLGDYAYGVAIKFMGGIS